MGEDKRKYKFSWDFIGTANTGDTRPSLGPGTTLEVYRLFQFTIRDVLEQRCGTETADAIFREAGVLAGRAFFERYCAGAADIPALARIIQTRFKELAVGIVRFEKVDLENMEFQLTVDEDLDCSGLPDTADHICVYDEGLIKGILDAFSGLDFKVREVDCWCSGERTCRFRAGLAAAGADA